MNARGAIVTLALVTLPLLSGNPASTAGGQSTGAQMLAEASFTYQLKLDKRKFHAGEAIEGKAILTNADKKDVAMDRILLLKYCNYESAPTAALPLGATGQVIADQGGDVHTNIVVIAAKESVTQRFDLLAILEDVVRRPGRYRVSFDYCYSGPTAVNGVPAPTGCIKSTEVLFEIER